MLVYMAGNRGKLALLIPTPWDEMLRSRWYWRAIAGPLLLSPLGLWATARADTGGSVSYETLAIPFPFYMEAVTSPERQRARALAEEYRSRGYEVIEEPSPAQLPDFLSGYCPDLLVRKGDEAIVVEVKSRSSLSKD